MLRNFNPVIQPADEPQPDQQKYENQRRSAGAFAAGDGLVNMTRSPPDNDGEDNNDPAHSGRAALRVVRGRAVLANKLTELLIDQPLRIERGDQ